MRNLSRSIFYILIFFPTIVIATNPPDVVINEVAWMGRKIEEVESKYWWQYEWIELYNNTDQEINLSGWQIKNGGAKNRPLKISQGKIPAKGFFLVCKKEIEGCHLKNRGLSLNDNYQMNGPLILKNNLDEIIDQTPKPHSKKWPAGNKKTKQTMERKNPKIEGSNFDNWQTSQNPGGTPGTKNSIDVKSQIKTTYLTEVKSEQITYPSGIVINEILPSSSSPDVEEWIEIFNQNDFEVDLSNWQITDLEGKTKTYTFPIGTKISPKGFFVLSQKTTKIILNNKADGLNLIQPNKNIVDSVIYRIAPRGKSFNRTEKEWVWSDILTPGSQNIISSSLKSEFIFSEENKKVAAIGEQILKNNSHFFFILFIALFLAISSGIIILLLKKKVKNFDLLEKLE